MSEALTGLLMGADPIANRATADGLTLRGLLDGAAERVQKELVDQPEAQAEIFTVIGRMYRRLGIYDKAQHLLERALTAGQAAFGPEHASVAQTLNDLGALAAEMGDYKTAAASLESALSMRRRIYGPEHTNVADTLAELGRIYQDQGLNERAEPLHREALAIRRKALGDEHGETAVSLSDLASVLRLNGDLEGAEALLRQSLEVNRKTRGEAHAMTATTLHDFALVTAARGDVASAESIFRRAMDTHRKALGESHPLVAVTLNSLSRIFRDQGRYDEAAAALEAALGHRAPGARERASTDRDLHDQSRVRPVGTKEAAGRRGADCGRACGSESGRLNWYRTAGASFLKTIGASERRRALLGASLIALARYSEAEAVLLEARGDLAAVSPPSRRDVHETISRLIDLYVAWGKPDKAARYRVLLASAP